MKKIKNLLQILVLTLVLLQAASAQAQLLGSSRDRDKIYFYNYCGEYVEMSFAYSCTLGSYGPYLTSDGYSCVYKITDGSWIRETITCTKAIPPSYSANMLSPYALLGVYNAGSSNIVTAWRRNTWTDPSPYLYFYNAPSGEISVSVDSSLDKFSPAPAFTKAATWNLTVESDGKMRVADKTVPHLFYRLAIDDITLSRNGINFSSESDLLAYLQTSDFFERLGFSAEEKANSLKTIIGDLKSSAESPYYYLTILDQESVEDVSRVVIEPSPEKLVRTYFAVYPTPVAVKTVGDLVFPLSQESGTEYVVKETGELLLTPDTLVKFK